MQMARKTNRSSLHNPLFGWSKVPGLRQRSRMKYNEPMNWCIHIRSNLIFDRL